MLDKNINKLILRLCCGLKVFVGDGEVISGSLISKAVDCSLRSLLLEKNWKCVGDEYIVNSSFSPSEEKSHVYALDVVNNIFCLDN